MAAENENIALIFGASGLDLTSQVSTCEKLETIPHIRDVTHVYFVAYTGHGGSPRDVVEVNSAILENALLAVSRLCSEMRFFTLQTGGKGYGAAGHPFPPAPWKEDLPRLPEPFASDIFYYAQYDIVAKHAARKSWKWSEIRPSYLVRTWTAFHLSLWYLANRHTLISQDLFRILTP
ncbi:hypothetical protein QQX98_002582 [Neonectria punicea]|uniref:PRISE-like Rossmann-fold domain-containing protein n=1 Tax=Neonectria punicea TaxID=979145 RepID=A0ABR1HHX8_9HYPO